MLCIQTNGERPIVSNSNIEMSVDDVWIRVAYAGLCRTDVLVAQGLIPVQKNRILGHECSGVISYVPPQCGLLVGMPVTVNPLLSDGFIGIDRDGAFADGGGLSPNWLVRPSPGSSSLVPVL